jgi:hypothetical protein
MFRYKLWRVGAAVRFQILDQSDRVEFRWAASNGIHVESMSYPDLCGNLVMLRGVNAARDDEISTQPCTSEYEAIDYLNRVNNALNELVMKRYGGIGGLVYDSGTPAAPIPPTKPPYFIKAEFHRVGATIHMHVKDQYGGNERPGGKWPTFTATNGMRVISNNNPAINAMDIFVRGRSPTARDQVDAFMGSDAQAQTLMLKMVAAIDEFNAFYGGKKKVWVSEDELEPSTEKPTFDMPKRR